MRFIERVSGTIEEYGMIERGDTVLVGLSGGPDSVALLYLLLELCSPMNLRIVAFHLDHRLRPESAEDAAFVSRLCRALGVGLESESFDVLAYIQKEGLSVEDGARRVRYRLLERAANKVGADKIALGHHADDQVETFLMRIIRGSGLAGLTSIPPVRGRFIRPLIGVRRGEILAFLAEKSANFVIDASNEDTSYLRNRVRAHLIPELLEYNPAFVDVALQNVRSIRDDETLLEELGMSAFRKTAEIEEDGSVVIEARSLSTMAPALARRVVRKGIETVKGDLLGIDFRHVKLILDGLAAGSLSQDLPGEVAAILERGKLVIFRTGASGLAISEEIEVRIPGELPLPKLGVAIEGEIVDADHHSLLRVPGIAQLDYDLLKAPLIVRAWRPGDFFYPLGMKGRKKVQDFLVDEKISRRKRRAILVLQAGGDIVWLAGLRIDDRYKVSPSTRRIALLRLKPIDVHICNGAVD